jgi:hypothetical protein
MLRHVPQVIGHGEKAFRGFAVKTIQEETQTGFKIVAAEEHIESGDLFQGENATVHQR